MRSYRQHGDHAQGPISGQQTRRLLLIDDTKDYLDLLAYRFTQVAYHVTTAVSFQQAICCLQAAIYDVFISDLNLGDGMGDMLLRQAQEQSPRPLTVLMSAEIHVRQYAQACKADAWFVKGSPIEDLVALVHQ